MDWIRQDKCHSESDSKQYRISIVYSREKYTYAEWRRAIRDGQVVWPPILYTLDISAAKRVCEEDCNVR
jgi:hypothetical protein